MEREAMRKFTIEEMKSEDVVEANKMRLQSWADTYVNDEAGVTKAWIEERNKQQMSAEKMKDRIEKLKLPNTAAWIARDENGKIIGQTTHYVDNNGIQHVGSLYVEKSWHGAGVAAELMQKVIDWFDPAKPIQLGVVAYNERAKAFYRKWGFKEVPNSETLFADKIPEVMMIRPGDKQKYKNLNPKLEIKDSPIEGKGIFTKVPIKKDQKLEDIPNLERSKWR